MKERSTFLVFCFHLLSFHKLRIFYPFSVRVSHDSSILDFISFVMIFVGDFRLIWFYLIWFLMIWYSVLCHLIWHSFLLLYSCLEILWLIIYDVIALVIMLPELTSHEGTMTMSLRHQWPDTICGGVIDSRRSLLIWIWLLSSCTHMSFWYANIFFWVQVYGGVHVLFCRERVDAS